MKRLACREIHWKILSYFLRFGAGKPVFLGQIRAQLRFPRLFWLRAMIAPRILLTINTNHVPGVSGEIP